MKTLFVVGGLSLGGAEGQLVAQAIGLARAGLDPEVACLTRGDDLEGALRQAGVPVHWIGRSPHRVVRAAAVADLARRVRPAVVQSASFHANLYAVAAARACGAAEIGALRNDLAWAVGRHGRASLLVPRHLAANSDVARLDACEMGRRRDRTHLVPNVVDTTRFRPRDRRHDADRPVHVVWIGRLIDQKDPLTAAHLLRRLVEVDGVSATMVGDGPLAQAVDAVRGPVAHLRQADPADVLADADLLLSTSVFEGTPNVVLEAMAAGLPVVVPDLPGCLDLLGSRHRRQAVPRADLERAARDLVHDAEARAALGAANRRLAEQRSLDSIATVLTDLHKRVIASG